jgi:pimeloyl-ACP methyl ester carboxylesterase
MFATLHDMNAGDKSADGVLVQKVVDANGNERLVVYLNGTDASDRMTVAENLDAALNPKVDQEIRDRIDKALRESGYDPNDKSKQPPIMLVGYSQGGMDAERIAAMHQYNVTTLVTYGAPLVVADQPGITTVHLRAVGDNIPNVPAEILAAPTVISNPVVGLAQEAALRNGWSVGVPGNTIPLTDPLSGPSHNIYTVDPHVPDATDGTGSYAGNHTIEKTYLTVGSDFDKSTDPDLVAKQKAIAAFQGSVVKEWQPDPSAKR